MEPTGEVIYELGSSAVQDLLHTHTRTPPLPCWSRDKMIKP